VILEI
jgi:hypothetical protein